jgi:hypothetical protein
MKNYFEQGTRVQIVSERPRYNGKTGVITHVSVTYTVALDEMLDADDTVLLEVKAKPTQLRVA